MATVEAKQRCGWLPWWVFVMKVEGFPCFLSSNEFPSRLGNFWWCALCFLRERNNTASAALVLGFCSSSSFDCISCFRTACAMVCFALPLAFTAIASYSLAVLCWKLVDLVSARVVIDLSFCCLSEHSCHLFSTACSDFALPAFFRGHCLTCSTSQTLCIILL